MNKQSNIEIIGAGLAGCEAAWAIANAGYQVELYEMKPEKHSPAHKSNDFAELVCSNSLKADRPSSAGGLLKAEMRVLGSLLLEVADKTRVPAGGALAVDRHKFSAEVTSMVKAHKNIKIINTEVKEIPEGNVIIATGPLTSDDLALSIEKMFNSEYLSFYDAAAPIVEGESINMERAFFAARYDRGEPDYINCPFTKEEYENFYRELAVAQKVELKEFEKDIKVYEGCMPIEILASRGQDTMRFGPLKPVGLTDPKTDRRPYAVAQLRKEDTAGNQYNLVGFQTNLKFPEQKRVFSLIPGLENAEFSRYGVMHRNTFINGPKLLNFDFTAKENNNIMFAGQITGVEGYMESAASGIITARNLIRRLKDQESLKLPLDTMIGALTNYATNSGGANFQPMGANMGMLPPIGIKAPKQERYTLISKRAMESLNNYLTAIDY